MMSYSSRQPPLPSTVLQPKKKNQKDKSLQRDPPSTKQDIKLASVHQLTFPQALGTQTNVQRTVEAFRFAPIDTLQGSSNTNSMPHKTPLLSIEIFLAYQHESFKATRL